MTTDTLLPFATPKTRNALIEQVMSRAAGSHSRYGNRIEVLLDSTENFPAWGAALRAAQVSVCNDMYILAPDALGRPLRATLLHTRHHVG